MAYIRLRIDNREFELEGSEEFIARMESKLMDFLEKTASNNSNENTNTKNLYQNTSSVSNSSMTHHKEATEDYIKGFVERYNHFNPSLPSK